MRYVESKWNPADLVSRFNMYNPDGAWHAPKHVAVLISGRALFVGGEHGEMYEGANRGVSILPAEGGVFTGFPPFIGLRYMIMCGMWGYGTGLRVVTD